MKYDSDRTNYCNNSLGIFFWLSSIYTMPSLSHLNPTVWVISWVIHAVLILYFEGGSVLKYISRLFFIKATHYSAFMFCLQAYRLESHVILVNSGQFPVWWTWRCICSPPKWLCAVSYDFITCCWSQSWGQSPNIIAVSLTA